MKYGHRIIAGFGLIVISFVAVFLMIFPVYHAEKHTPQGYVFSGQASWFDPWDLNVYVSAVRWGQTGSILLPNLYTTDQNRPILMYPTYTALGRLFPHTDPFMVFYAASAVTALLLVVFIYAVCGEFIRGSAARLTVTAGVVLGGGFGFLLYPRLMPDISMTSFTFMSALQRPHEAIGTIAYIAFLSWFYRLIRTHSTGMIRVAAGFAAAMAALYYPYLALTMSVIAGLAQAVCGTRQWKNAAALIVSVIIPPLAVSYAVWNHMGSNPAFAGVVTQALATPSLPSLLAGYGILVPLAAYSATSAKGNSRVRYLLLWVIVSLICAYLPLGISRFFLRGLFFPMVTVGVIALVRLSEKLNLPRYLLFGLFILLLVPSSVFVFSKRMQEAGSPNPWFYLTADDSASVSFLAQLEGSEAGVLALYTAGNMLPALTGQPVFMGHLIQTPHAAAKIEKSMAFYGQSESGEDAYGFLYANRITYVYVGSEEYRATGGRPFSMYPFVKHVFSSGNSAVYRVEKP